jgi:hypothetical protein
VLNDEAHHCYRQRTLSEEERLDREAQAEARDNNVVARLWISGIESLKRKVGLRAVYDLSATPFFLRGSGYREGTLFPWVVSDFSLMDAIECGIVKLPRIPLRIILRPPTNRSTAICGSMSDATCCAPATRSTCRKCCRPRFAPRRQTLWCGDVEARCSGRGLVYGPKAFPAWGTARRRDRRGY